MSISPRLFTAGLAALLLAGPLAVPATAAPAVTAVKVASATTSSQEKRRVDRVKTPKLRWTTCYRSAQCATAYLPLDYDQPDGPKTRVGLLRIRAKDQKRRIGSLFVNPGGPGAPATDFALAASQFLSPALLNRFDIVGMDPRGIGLSSQVNCFGTQANQDRQLAAMHTAFPYGEAEEREYITAARNLGKACSTRGAPLSGAMSTAEVARDMDVMRRAVGDKKLSYLGFSYGTALGQYYANMFPDRFRALAVDGVINPVGWVGTPATAGIVQDVRLNSAGGAYQAFAEIMRRCDRAGVSRCPFTDGHSAEKFRQLTERLKESPLVIRDGLGELTLSYADFIGLILGALYTPVAGDLVAALSQEVVTLMDTTATARSRSASATEFRRLRALARAYDNSIDSYAGVMCTDARHPADASMWPAQAAAADERAPYFGRAWVWASVQCARNSWTIRDEDAYLGPFHRRTGTIVLVVGSTWDPATNYDDAVSVSRLLPSSRLLTSKNWGHTAYGSSPCVTAAMDDYLLKRVLPVKGKVCVSPDQPFTGALTLSVRATAAQNSRPPLTGVR